MQISGYKLVNTIGQGGMATVYEAIQTSLNRKVAIKILSPSLVADPDFCKRFLKEGKILAQLSHPNIITIYDIGDSGGAYYMSMEYLENGNLRSRIDEGLTENEAIDITLQIASALGYAHDRGFLHRDVKPLNVLFHQDGTAVLTDFGIAKSLSDHNELTQTGSTIGSPLYMSPEQIRDETLDIRSDLYSLGVVMYQMLTGYAPYLATTADSTTRMHLTCPLPQLPDHLDHYQPIIRRLLAKSRNNRFLNSWELIDAIKSIQAQREQQRMKASALSEDHATTLSLVKDESPVSAKVATLSAEQTDPTIEVKQPSQFKEPEPVTTANAEPPTVSQTSKTVLLSANREALQEPEPPIVNSGIHKPRDTVLVSKPLEQTQELRQRVTPEKSAKPSRLPAVAGFALIAGLVGYVLLPNFYGNESESERHSETVQLAGEVENKPAAEVAPQVDAVPQEETANEPPGLLIALNDPVSVPETAAVELQQEESSNPASADNTDSSESARPNPTAGADGPAQESMLAGTSNENTEVDLPSLESRAEAAQFPSLEERAAAALAAPQTNKNGAVQQPGSQEPEDDAPVTSTAGANDDAQNSTDEQNNSLQVKPLEQVANVSERAFENVEEQRAAFVKQQAEDDLQVSAQARYQALQDSGIMPDGEQFQINYELEAALRTVSDQVFRNSNGSVLLVLTPEQIFQPESDAFGGGGERRLGQLAYIFRNYSGFGIRIISEPSAYQAEGILDISKLRVQRMQQYFVSSLVDSSRVSTSLQPDPGFTEGSIQLLLQPSI